MEYVVNIVEYMRKFIVTSILLCSMVFIGISTCFAQEISVSCSVYSIDDYNGLKLYAPISRIVNFWWTGNEYIWRDPLKSATYSHSSDMNDWQELGLTDGLQYISNHSRATYSINHWGEKYIVYNRCYEFPADLESNAKRGEDSYVYPLTVLDDHFNLIENIDFGAPITSVSYVGGKYYLQTQVYDKSHIFSDPQKTVYVSNDAISWQKTEDLTEVPLSNNRKYDFILSGTRQNSRNYYMRALSAIGDGSGEYSPISLEGSLNEYFKAYDNMYISYTAYDSKANTFKISCDGVYWIDISYPKLLTEQEVYPDRDGSGNVTVEAVFEYMELKDKILFQTNQNRLFEYNKADLSQAWYDSFGTIPTYIKFNDTILAFETSPIIENDRTLIPIRFLFEQMGADVDWNGDTQTAMITQNDTAVAFSIDKAYAKVNGKSKKMDVPARLINGKTMVPVRFLSEELGYDVEWDEETRIITIECK